MNADELAAQAKALGDAASAEGKRRYHRLLRKGQNPALDRCYQLLRQAAIDARGAERALRAAAPMLEMDEE